jgi:hypothetical protein
MTRRSTDWVLLGTAVLAFLFVVFRAHIQSITIDEALSYSNFVGPDSGPLWVAASNNHLLNSLLMWIFTSLFGVSHLTVRAGALTGAALYISAAYVLCCWIAEGLVVRWALLLCLVGNPFILDFLVAARGYGLASGLLLWAIVAIAAAQRRGLDDGSTRSLAVGCGQASVLAALSFMANFSFAFADAALLIMVSVWACATLRGRGAGFGGYLRIYAACVLPGLLLAGVLAGPVIVKFTKDELVYGAPSFRILLRSLYEATTYEINPRVPSALRPSSRWVGVLFRAIGILSVIQLGVMLFKRGGDSQSRWLRGLVGVVAGTVAISLAASWAAFRFAGVLWPQDRTGIYFVVLLTLLVGMMAAVRVTGRSESLTSVPRMGLTIAMFGLAIYFGLCLRVGYFKEWNWGADTDKVYAALASYNHSCGLKSVAANWRYDAVLNFNRSVAHGDTFDKFPGSLSAEDYPEGKQGYVLSLPDDQAFLAKHDLKVVYRSELGSTIALDPAVCPGAGLDSVGGR